jgi:quinol monooxygenase YgiN
LASLITVSEVITRTRRELGCARYDIDRDNDDPDAFVVSEIWENLKYLKTHLASRRFARTVKALKALLAEEPVLRVMTLMPDHPPTRMGRPRQEVGKKYPKTGSWLLHGKVRYSLPTGIAYFSKGGLSVCVVDDSHEYGIIFHRLPLCRKAKRTALSTDHLTAPAELQSPSGVLLGFRKWKIFANELALHSDKMGVELGGNLSLRQMEDPPPTDHLSLEEEATFLRKYYAAAKATERKVGFQVKARWCKRKYVESGAGAIWALEV